MFASNHSCSSRMDGSLPCVILSIEALFSSGKPFMYKKDFAGHTYICVLVLGVLKNCKVQNINM